MKKAWLLLPLLLILFSCASTKDDGAASRPVIDVSAAKSGAVETMNKAKSVKADVAAKEQYDRAMAEYNAAESLAAAGSEDEAAIVEKYTNAQNLFNAAYNTADAKRQAALRQLEKAKADIKNVENDASALEEEQARDAQGGTQ